MSDKIRDAFLERQLAEAQALNAESDLVAIAPFAGDGWPPCRYLVTYRCRGLVCHRGEVREAAHFEVGLWFPEDYLRRIEPQRTLHLFGPAETWHPNVRFPFICPGHVQAGTSLVDLVYQIFEILTYQKLATHDALNGEAAAYAREHMERFPIDRRPLKRRRLRLTVSPSAPSAEGGA